MECYKKCLWGKKNSEDYSISIEILPSNVIASAKIRDGFCYKRVGVRRTVFYTFVVVFADVVVAAALYLLPKVLRLPYVTLTTSETDTSCRATVL